MNTMDGLLAAIEHEARRLAFPVDEVVYEKAGKDPRLPILCAGSLEAGVCEATRGGLCSHASSSCWFKTRHGHSRSFASSS